MSDAPNGKKWRVDPPAGVGHGYYFKHQPAAYRKVAALVAEGKAVTVYEWEADYGRWALYERVCS